MGGMPLADTAQAKTRCGVGTKANARELGNVFEKSSEEVEQFAEMEQKKTREGKRQR